MERRIGTPSDDAPPAREDSRLLTSGEVARLFGVDPKTVARWADAGRIEALRTLGGHRRYRRADVVALLDGDEYGPSSAAS